MYKAIDYSYCRPKFGSPCDVILKMYDAAGVLTTKDDSLVVKRVYEISIRKLISGVSTTNILVAKTTTKSTITVELPSVV